MAPRQRTFELIPNAPQGLGQQQHQQQPQQQQKGQPVFSKPPMTTKQAKKLHRQANKGPKLSKAEQRRIELMEQDRIRKEFDKEKAQARARTARDRKKAKDDKEKEERRRKGLPAVDPHASQDMISRFLSWGPAKKQYPVAPTSRLDIVREEGTDTDTATDTVTDAEAGSGADAEDEGDDEDEGDTWHKEHRESADESGDERRAKRPRLNLSHQTGDKPPEETDCLARSHRSHHGGPVAKIAQELGADSYSRANSVDTDDPTNENLLETQIIAEMVLASSRKLAQQTPTADLSPPPALDLSAVTIPTKEPSRQHEPQRPQSPVWNVPLANIPDSTSARPHFGGGPFKKPKSPYVSVKGQGQTDKIPANRLQPAFRGFNSPAAKPGYSSERPKFLPKHMQTPRQPQPTPHAAAQEQSNPQFAQPSSTQALLLLNADEFTASPSQEAKELSGSGLVDESEPAARSVETSGKPSTNLEASTQQHSVTPSLTRLEPTLLLPRFPAAADVSALDFLICTQELCMSSQDIRDIDTPSKVREPIKVGPSARIANKKGVSAGPLKVHAPKSAGPTGSVSRVFKESTAVATISDPGRCTGRSSQSPVVSRNGAGPSVDATAKHCQCQLGSVKVPGVHHCEGHKTSSSVPRSTASQKAKENCTSRFPHGQRASLKHPRATPQPNNSTAALAHVQNTTPQQSPARRRMFGSSGPGAEVLVAMQRSYQQSRREERAREESLRDEERKLLVQNTTTTRPTAEEQMDLEQLMELAEDFPDDDVSSFTKAGSEAGRVVPTHADTTAEGADCGNDKVRPMASQETDYGDFEYDEEREVLEMLERDTTWLDDDLDEFI